MQTIFEKTQYVLGSCVPEILHCFLFCLTVCEAARELGVASEVDLLAIRGFISIDDDPVRPPCQTLRLVS